MAAPNSDVFDIVMSFFSSSVPPACSFLHVLHQGHGSASKNYGGEEDNYQGCSHQHLPDLVIKLQMQRQSVGDGSSKTREPHNNHHLLCNLMRSKLVAEQRQWEDVESSAQ